MADALDLLVAATPLASAVALRRERTLCVLAVLAGALWLAGDAVGPLVFAHRAPLTQLFLIYPGGPICSRRRRIAIAAVWVSSFAYPIGVLDSVTVVTAVLVVLGATNSFRPVPAADRPSTVAARTAAVSLWGVLAGAAVARACGLRIDDWLLPAYEIVVIAAVATVVVDHWYRRSRGALVTNLVLDLGAGGNRSLRAALSQALGDPSVAVGLETVVGLVDEDGRPVSFSTRPGMTVTELREDGERLAVLQHDAALQPDRKLLDSVTVLATLALTNSRLQQELERTIVDVESSRRRLLTVADTERARLEGELQAGVLKRLATVAAILEPLRSDELSRHVREAEETVRSFARGVYPRAFREQGLAAVHDLELAGGRVMIDVPVARFPSGVEAAAYFVCLEAVTNAAKYAQATTTRIVVASVGDALIVEVADDGIGGADPARGTGLVGLQDRLEVLGGTFTVASTSAGTSVRASIPLGDIITTEPTVSRRDLVP